MPQNEADLKLDSYDFHLPEQLIAQRPSSKRSDCKLLVYEATQDKVTHASFADIGDFLPTRSTLIFNRSKVIPCRLFGKKATGGECELVVLSLEESERGFQCLIKCSGKKREGQHFFFADGLEATIHSVSEGLFWVQFNRDNIRKVLEKTGIMPIPPYIRGGVADTQDRDDYQTVYAHEPGSVAAPTAGLHFDAELMGNLQERDHKLAYVTLHVGLGTFAPVKKNDLREHEMHTEAYCIDEDNLKLIESADYRIAVGTTSLRAMESAYQLERMSISPLQLYQTNIFLYPGVAVKSVDALITNFHLPKSTLLMLVASLIGREKTLELYQLAIEKEYRFYSYGDAMLILR